MVLHGASYVDELSYKDLLSQVLKMKVLLKGKTNGISDTEQQLVDHKNGLTDHGQVKLVELKHS